MFYRNTEERPAKLEIEGKALIKTFLYYSLWVDEERGPWYRGLVVLTDRRLTLRTDDHTVFFPNEAILKVKLIKTPVEIKGVSSIAITYPFSERQHSYIKLCLIGPSTIISALYGILRRLSRSRSRQEPDATDLKLLLLLKAGIRDLRIASLILEEDLQNLYIRTAKLLRAGLIDEGSALGEALTKKT